MSTIGNMAMQQYRAAVFTTKYNYAMNNAYNKQNKYDITKTAADYDKFWENITKDKDAYIQEQYEKLYNSVFGIKDEEAADKTVTLKQASNDVMSSAEAISGFAKGLKFGGEYDTETAQKYIEDFVSDYNTFIDKLGDAEDQQVLQKGVIMVNTAKVYSGSLGRVGIDVGSDNKLTFNKDYMSEISATDLRLTFGDMGFSEKTAQKAEQINRLAGSSGFFSYTAASTQNYSYNIGALFSTYA
ncbi:MAG: hypothetical protein IJO91_11175 [Oscillospiraceae bacterium]|nr:hypothetical protein [Oscillospiraceae bacterium]